MTDLEGLDAAALAPIRDELIRYRDFLGVEIEAQGSDPDSDDVNFVDDGGFVDRGQSSEERSQVIAVVRALRSNLRDVARALSKMETGTYGMCERWGQPISRERLEALPWAELCIDRKQRVGSR